MFGGFEYLFGLSPQGAVTSAQALLPPLPEGVKETAATVGANAAEVLERSAYMEIIDEMPVLGELWDYVPERKVGRTVQAAHWRLTDKGQAALKWGGMALAAVAALYVYRQVR